MTDVADAPAAPTASRHRERLLSGMADAIREKGFRRTTVADVVRHARVSRRTFYEQFDDLVACYLALAEALSALILKAISDAAAASAGEPRDVRLERAVDAYLQMMAADPALTRSYGLELHLAGERGHALMQSVAERTAQLLVALIDDAREQEPELNPLTTDTAIMASAGIRELAMRAQERGTPMADVRAAATDLLRAVLTAPSAP